MVLIMEDKIRLGISSCLLGENVRYDGGHRRDPFLTQTLSQYAEYIPVCPEVECGLGVPRESMRLIGQIESPRLVTSRSNIDLTDQMKNWAKKRLNELEKQELCGFIFKADSPSSGMERVKVYDNNNVPAKKGIGIFAGMFMEHFPLIPVEEDGRLHDPLLRENFIEQIFTLKRWRDLMKNTWTMGNLVDFHSRNKLLILSHSEKHYRMMGKLVAEGKKTPIKKLFGDYETYLMEALRLKPSIKKNVNVLLHMVGYFKTNLSADEKKELLEIINQYRENVVPLIVPISLINHYVRKYHQPYLGIQTYLNPHPIELKLRNHA
ncbi:conserved hypothetical protein [uncultured Desulfobacterium sp.]|uniref:DUF1722 domain-containing protein n=1 Tax=uncultured Desulfobacterium sp. TaxID=201089 RepID=A0A445MXQ8_9BACT|nr:conserved hypothetical protein [uncultured Desulfobacterium sp.]